MSSRLKPEVQLTSSIIAVKHRFLIVREYFHLQSHHPFKKFEHQCADCVIVRQSVFAAESDDHPGTDALKLGRIYPGSSHD